MFYGCADFNQPLNNWNTGSATSMSTMFFQCSSFDQSLAAWDISSVSSFGLQFGFSLNLSTTNYDATLVSWNNQNVQTLTQNVDFGESVPSCDNAASNGAFAARANLMTSNKWNVSIVDKFSTSNKCQPLAGFDYTSDEYCVNASPSTVDPTIIGTPDSLSYITESYSVAQTFSGLNGQANTGGGGGGGASRLSSSSSISANGGSGGSGIVILKYPTNLNATFSAGLTKTDVVSGSDTITSVTAGSGAVTFANAGTLSEYLIVAGGGGGGGSQWYSGFWQSSGAGGGAGGLLTATNLSVSAQSYNITVGEGGTGGLGVVDNSGTTRNCGQTGTSGQNSIFSSFTAIGGGGGGGATHNGNSGTYACSNGDGLNGGSGGGAGGIVSGNSAARTAGTGTAGQGNNGGGPGSGRSANGGGGAGAAGSGGAVNSSPGGDGGIGVISSITGNATYYAGGGGGGGYWQNAVGNGTGGNGGTGGGGAGGTSKP
jgi:surface protein